MYIPVQHSEIFSVLVATLALQVEEHSGLTSEHCIERDCDTLLVEPHGDGTAGDHMDQPSGIDTTSVGKKELRIGCVT